MKSDKDEVALQGIEFWSTVCDEEADLAIEAVEAAESGHPPDQTSRFYVKGAMQYLVPILLETLTKQVSACIAWVIARVELILHVRTLLLWVHCLVGLKQATAQTHLPLFCNNYSLLNQHSKKIPPTLSNKFPFDEGII